MRIKVVHFFPSLPEINKVILILVELQLDW